MSVNEANVTKDEAQPEEQVESAKKGQACKTASSRWPFVFSVLAVVIAAVFGFGISSNIMGVDKQLAKEMQTIEQLQQKVHVLEGLVQQAGTAEMVRNELNSAATDDVIRRVEGLKGSVADEELIAALQEAQTLLQQVKAALDEKRLVTTASE